MIIPTKSNEHGGDSMEGRRKSRPSRSSGTKSNV
jgi:hypothetical protein